MCILFLYGKTPRVTALGVLRLIRKELALTQNELANLIYITKSRCPPYLRRRVPLDFFGGSTFFPPKTLNNGALRLIEVIVKIFHKNT